MENKQRVFIRGVEGRGSEVIKMLEDRGGWNGYPCNGKNDKLVYYINHRGIIDFEYLNSETARIIMDNYHELKLPGQWKDGDILTVCGKNFCIFQDYSENFPGMFRAYINLEACLKLNDDKLYDKEYYRLATEDEINFFHSQLHKIGKDWDAENKQLVDWKWKPEIHEDYFFC